MPDLRACFKVIFSTNVDSYYSVSPSPFYVHLAPLSISRLNSIKSLSDFSNLLRKKMITHVDLPRNYHILIETPTGAIDSWNDHILTCSPSHRPYHGIAGMELIPTYLLLFDDTEGSNKPLSVPLPKVLDVILCQTLA
jgi:hypothetical protein